MWATAAPEQCKQGGPHCISVLSARDVHGPAHASGVAGLLLLSWPVTFFRRRVQALTQRSSVRTVSGICRVVGALERLRGGGKETTGPAEGGDGGHHTATAWLAGQDGRGPGLTQPGQKVDVPEGARVALCLQDAGSGDSGVVVVMRKAACRLGDPRG